MKRLVKIIFVLQCILGLAQEGEYTKLDYTCNDNVQRPFIVYQPNSVEESQSAPLMVYLHGAVSSPNLKKDPLAYIQKSKLLKLADEYGFYLMFSYGQKGATWFDSVGTNMVLGEIELIKEKFNIKNDKIFLSGFSDGGTGVVYMSTVYPEKFAGFIAMNGSVKLADKLGEFDVYPENINQKGMYMINTTQDAIYPLSQMKPSGEYFNQFNTNSIFVSPAADHEMSYIDEEYEALGEFIANNRNDFLSNISLETSNVSVGRLAWLEISKIDTLSKAKEWHKPYKLKVFNDKAYIGLGYDYSYQGKGLKVKSFKEKHHSAKNMGIKIGDIILKMEEDEMTSPYAPYMYRAKKKAGEKFNITVLRDNKEEIIQGVFDQGYEYDLFSHKKVSAKVMAKIVGDELIIKTSNVSEFKVRYELIPQRIKKIIINGKKIKVNKKAKIVVYGV